MTAAGGRLDSLQVLRGVAALAVVVFHLGWTGIASFGVQLFFVISGFIICHAGMAAPDRFLLKRLARVVPLYWLATLGVAAAALVLPALFPATDPTPANLLRSLFFIPYQRADGEAFPLLFLGWTLNYEMAFYLIFAGCLLVSRKYAPWLALAALLVLMAARPMLAPFAFPFEFWTRPILFHFVTGIMAWLWWSDRSESLGKLPISLAATAALALFAGFVSGLWQGWSAVLPVDALAGALLLLSVLRLDGALRWPALVLLIGDASYSLYLLHPYAVEAIDRLVHPFGSDVAGIFWSATAVTSSIAIAIVSYRLVEAQSNRWLRRRLT